MAVREKEVKKKFKDNRKKIREKNRNAKKTKYNQNTLWKGVKKWKIN